MPSVNIGAGEGDHIINYQLLLKKGNVRIYRVLTDGPKGFILRWDTRKNDITFPTDVPEGSIGRIDDIVTGIINKELGL